MTLEQARATIKDTENKLIFLYALGVWAVTDGKGNFLDDKMAYNEAWATYQQAYNRYIANGRKLKFYLLFVESSLNLNRIVKQRLDIPYKSDIIDL